MVDYVGDPYSDANCIGMTPCSPVLESWITVGPGKAEPLGVGLLENAVDLGSTGLRFAPGWLCSVNS